jgi:hypothetical protein
MLKAVQEEDLIAKLATVEVGATLPYEELEDVVIECEAFIFSIVEKIANKEGVPLWKNHEGSGEDYVKELIHYCEENGWLRHELPEQGEDCPTGWHYTR